MKFFRKPYSAQKSLKTGANRIDHRATKRIETEARLTITSLNGEIHVGVLRNMNTEAIAAHVEADFEPGNRVTVSYRTDESDEQVEVQAIVRRRNGSVYVLDTSLADIIAGNRDCW